MDKKYPVTDHAVLRWLERVAMVDIEEVRRQIYSETREALKSGATRVVINGTDYRIKNGTVITLVQGRGRVKPLHWEQDQ